MRPDEHRRANPFVALVAAAMSAGLTIAFIVGLAVIVWLSP
jgi:hypothetical protein